MEDSIDKKITNIFLNSLFGFLLCVLIGLVFFGTNIFNPKLHTFQIVLFGIVGSIFYSVHKYGSLKESYVIGILLFIANFVFQGKAVTFVTILRDLVFFASLFSSLILYNYLLKKYFYSPKYIRALALALILVMFNVIATLFLISVYAASPSEALSGVLINARYAALVGVGIGLGIDLFNQFKTKIHSYIK